MRILANTPDGARADEALLEPLVRMDQVISPTPLLGVVLDSVRVGAPAETHAAGVNCIKGSSMQVN